MSQPSGGLNLKGSVGTEAEKTDKLPQLKQHLDALLGVEVLLLTGKVDRPTTDPIHKGAGHPMYLGISEQLQKKLGLTTLGDHLALVPIEGSVRFRIYLMSALIDDETFLSRAAKGSYAMSGIDSGEQASETTRSNPLSENSISLPKGKLGEAVKYFVLDARSSQGNLLPTLLSTRNYQDYSNGLRKKWEAENSSGLPILVLPNGVARLLGISTTKNTNLPENIGKTVVDGAVCTVRYKDGKVLKVQVVGARDSLGGSEELLAELGLKAGEECSLQINTGNRELIIDSNTAKDTAEQVHDSVVETLL